MKELNIYLLRDSIKEDICAILKILAIIVIVIVFNANPTYANESASTIEGSNVSRGVNDQTKSQVNSKIPKQVDISDDYGKQFIRKKLGDHVSSRLKYHVKAPLAKQFPEIKYTKAITPWTDQIWSGYIVESSNIQGVSGEFNAAPSQNGYDATWTGIGGVNGTGNLAQTGIDQKYMVAWTEVYPEVAQYWFYVNDGDQIISDVLYDSDTGNWFLLIADLTTGDYYYNEYSFNPDQTTAEWIVERAMNSNIGTFDTINFNSAYWYDSNNTKQNINSDAATALYQSKINWNSQSSVPSDIGLHGESFSIYSVQSETLTVCKPSTTGFTLELSPALNELTKSEFTLLDSSNNPVNITSAATLDNGATYTICASLTEGETYTVTVTKTGYVFGSSNVVVPEEQIPETLTVSNPSITGFTVGLSPALNGLTESDFILRDSWNNPVSIASVATSDSGAAYTIISSLAAGQTYTVTATKIGYDFGSPKNVVVPAVISEVLTVTNPSITEFTVGLSPALNGLTVSNFILQDSWNESVDINSAATSDNGSTYTISTSLKAGQTYTITATKVGYTFGTEKNVTVANGITFQQGSGYQTGAYDLNAAQPSAFNWTRQSQFKGPQHPTLKWAYPNYNSSFGSPVIGSDNTIYVVDHEYNSLCAFNANGSLKWRFSLSWGASDSSPTISADGTIFVGAAQGGLYAINPDGTQKWHFGNSSITCDTQPVIASDGTIYIDAIDYNAHGAYIFALNPANGNKIWATKNGTNYMGSSPIIAKDGTIYVGSQQFTALNPDGSIKWTIPISSGFSPTISADGTVFVASDKLYAINPDGSTKWAFTMDSSAYSSPAIAADGTIYITSSDKIYAVKSDGSKRWTFSIGNYISSTPIIGQDGTVYFGSNDYNIYAINPDGSQKWVYKTDSYVRCSPALGSDGTLFIESISRLYAIAESNVAWVPETLTVSNPSTTGFTVGLSPALNGLTKNDFTLRDSWNNLVNITSAATSNNGATYTISATMTAGQTYTVTATKTDYDFGTAQNVVVPTVPVEKTPPAMTVDTSNNTVGQSVNLTFTDDAAWRSAITEITADGTTLNSSRYTVTAGNINIAADVFTTIGDHTIVVKATGFNDATVTQTIVASNNMNYENRFVGALYYSLALKFDGTVVGWGHPLSALRNIPAGLNNVVKLAANNDHALALKSDGSVVAWGGNSFGETNVPAGLSGVTQIATGVHHSLVVKSDGTVIAWGWNANGQTNVPSGLTGVVSIASGYDFSLALKSDGTVVAWGNNNFGQTTVPIGLKGVVAVAAGDAFSLALKSDGTVVAWGYNGDGEINIPAGLNGVVAIAAEGYHSLALKSDRTVVAWGVNSQGQSSVPANLSGVVALAAGFDHSLALKSDGKLIAWGNNDYGQSNVPADLTIVAADSLLTASPLIRVGTNPTDTSSVGIMVGLQNITDSNGKSPANLSLTGYQVEIDFDPQQVNILGVTDLTTLGNLITNIDQQKGKVLISDTGLTGINEIDRLFFVSLNLVGTAGDLTNVTEKFFNTTDQCGNSIIVSEPATVVFQRGKIANDTTSNQVGISDTVAGLQYLAGICNAGLGTGEVNTVNMASILPPESGAKTITPSVKNVIALMQYLVGLRDSSFQLFDVSGPLLKINSRQISPGETGVVAITGQNIPSPGLAGFSISIEYDPLKLEVIGLEKSASDSFSMQLPNFDLPGTAKIVAIQNNGVEGDITLTRLRFRAKDSAVGITELKLSSNSLVLEDLKVIEALCINGQVDISTDSE